MLEARDRTKRELTTKQRELSRVTADAAVPLAVCLMGSWGRRELTRGSDDDWLAVGPREADEPPSSVVSHLSEVMGAEDREPGVEGVFGAWTSGERLAGQIGLDRDDNKNLTRRILLMLESLAVVGEDVYTDLRGSVLDGYLDPLPKDRHPPRFFLNDVVRYWRTICVDFVGKERERAGSGWGLRNAKLRNSRKMLFASGLLPILLTSALRAGDLKPFLAEQFDAPATDRVAYAFMACGADDPGSRALRAYDQFLRLLDDEEARGELKGLLRDDAASSPAFRDARKFGETLQDSLIALLFETDALRGVSRRYGIF